MFMSILHKGYFGCLRLLTSSDVEENPGPTVSHRSCRVVYANIRGLHKNLLNLSHMASGGEVMFSLRVLSLPDATFPSLWFRV